MVPEHSQQQYLSTELGVAPKHCQVCLKKGREGQKGDRIYAVSGIISRGWRERTGVKVLALHVVSQI